MVGVESLESHGAHPQAGGMGRTEESGRFSVASGKAGDLGKALQDVRNDGVALAGDDAQCVAGVALGLFVVTLRNLDARARHQRSRQVIALRDRHGIICPAACRGEIAARQRREGRPTVDAPDRRMHAAAFAYRFIRLPRRCPVAAGQTRKRDRRVAHALEGFGHVSGAVENTCTPELTAWADTSATMRLFPIPGGPTTLATQPCPFIERSSMAVSAASSQSRPTKVDRCGTIRLCCAAASSLRADTGVAAPLIRTSSGSPSTATSSTSRAVDSLSITPPGGAADSIRCAIPTCSPIAV